MLQQPRFNFSSTPMKENYEKMVFVGSFSLSNQVLNIVLMKENYEKMVFFGSFTLSNPVLNSVPQNKLEVDAFLFSSSGDGSSGKDQPFIVAQHEGTRLVLESTGFIQCSGSCI